ncbi:LADA_0H20032g1_1 [Lachancea dasiensis]|uniref:LADA_0H20032g1_1 n=1 Tax=Lachancea dasiensis TaxID=1072105 RepID=A0A1G4K6M2_9SACH|nr:LADA_0H20032g1_1 [Lachancea dasiensis]
MALGQKVLKSALEGVDFYCRKSDTKTLKKLAFFTGSKVGTTKASLRTSITMQCALLQQLSDVRKKNGRLEVTAVDMGVENFAYSRLSWKISQPVPEIIDWNKIQLQNSTIGIVPTSVSFSPKYMARAAQTLTDILTKRPPDLFVIEKQRARTMGSANIPDSILRVNALEHVLYTSLLAKRYYKELKYLLEASDPRRMTDFWCQLIPVRRLLAATYGTDSPKLESKANSSNLSKLLKIELVKSVIFEDSAEMFTLSTDLQQRVSSYQATNTKKKLNLFNALDLGPGAGKAKEDDLADSLLHGLAWLKWLGNFEELSSIILANPTDQAGLHAFNSFVKDKGIAHEHFSQSCINKL